jgi:hypothetical protein
MSAAIRGVVQYDRRRLTDDAEHEPKDDVAVHVAALEPTRQLNHWNKNEPTTKSIIRQQSQLYDNNNNNKTIIIIIIIIILIINKSDTRQLSHHAEKRVARDDATRHADQQLVQHGTK